MLPTSTLNREPGLGELRAIVDAYEVRLSGCIEAIACMHMRLKNCPKELKGQHRNPKDGKSATTSCQVLVHRAPYCWH